jgi:multidrug resistance protein MdtO
MTHAQLVVSAEDRQLAESIAQRLAEISQGIQTKHVPQISPSKATSSSSSLLRELETMIALIPQVFEGSISFDAFHAPGYEPEQKTGVFVHDAFSNPEHLQYALSGCLAGMLCYIFYVSLDWPGLSTSVTTCVLTALSNIGASRQKQVLRIVGAVIGGFVFGLGAQIFVLPYIDSITGFTLLFVAVSTVAAWISTSSLRLSYCGLQIALAFYLIHVNDFRIQTSLSIARDRAVGVLLGIAMMWVAFERLHPKSATWEMVQTFTGNLRLLSELTIVDVRVTDPAAIIRVRRLRDRIYNNFAAVNAQADAVPFEIGARRRQHMAARDRIRRWQAMLRTFYLLDLALLQYRAFGTTEHLSEEMRATLLAFDHSCARTLTDLAASLESQREDGAAFPPSEIVAPELPREFTEKKDSELEQGSIFSLAKEMARILDRLRVEVLSEPLFAAE